MADRLRVGVVGSGYFSQFHYDAWHRLDRTELVALASHDDSTARERAATYGVPAIFREAEAMLEGVEIDLLDIVTPPRTHLALVRAAAKRGLPVVCQKPLAPTLAEAEDIVRVAEAAGITLTVHENFRFQPWYRQARDLIAQGRLGRLHGIAFRLRPGDGQGPQAYLDRQPYFQTMSRFLIHETGIHFVDTFRSLMGEVTAVTARLRRLNPAIAGEDAGTVLFDFAGGASGLFDGNRLNDHSAQNCRLTMGEMHLEGSAGVLRLDGEGRLWWKPHGEAERQELYDWPRRGFAGGASGLFDGNRLNDHSAQNCRLTMGEMHLEGSAGVLRLDGEGRLWWKPHGEAEREELYDWSRRGFAGDCVLALQRHVAAHLLDGTPLVNSGRDYLTNLRIEEAIYRSHETGQRIIL